VIPPLLRGWLRTRPLRGVLAALAVALGVAALLAVQITLAGLDDQANAAQAARAGASGVDVRTVSGPGLGAADLARLRALHGVVQVSPLLEKSVVARASAASVQGLDVAVVGLDGGRAALRPLHLLSGRLPRDRSLTEAVLDQGVAGALRSTGATRTLRPGDTVHLVTRDGDAAFTVVGITAANQGGPAFSGASVFVTQAAASGPFAMGLRTPLAALRLAPGASAVAVAGAVEKALGGGALAVDPRAGAAGPLDQLRPLLLLVVALAGLICAGVSANTTALAVSERRREIGLLRAAGAGPRQVLRLLLAEAGVLGLAGAAAGVGAGVLLGGVAVTHLGASDQPIPPLSLPAWRLAGSAAAGLAAALLGALLPAVAAARSQPLLALRSTAEPTPHRSSRRLALAGLALAVGGAVTATTDAIAAVVIGCIALLVGAALCLPLISAPLLRAVGVVLSPLARTAPVAAAALARRRRRTALTLAGLVVSVATATALSALSSGAVTAGDRWVTQVFVGDIVVHSPATQPASIAQLLAATPGVREVTRVRFLSAVAGDNPLGVAAIDPIAHQASGALDVVDGDREAALTALEVRPSVLVPQELSSEFGWHRGSRITLAAAGGSLAVTVSGVVAHSLPAGDGREALLLGDGMAARLYGDAAVSGFDDLEVVSDGGGSALAAVSRVAALYGMNAVPVATIRDDARQALGDTLSLLEVLSWVAVAIAMLAVVNTLLVNARQGTRDLALLRAAGLSRRRALRLVLTEAGLLATTGTVLGIAAGCALALPLLRAGSSPGFDPQFAVPVGTAIAALGAVVLGSILAAALPARRAAQAAIVSAIRYD
jgi:putative ABC transport system permease protein